MEKTVIMRKLVLGHMMYLQYMRFRPVEEKRKLLVKMQDKILPRGFHGTIMKRMEEDAYLRYCPMCVREDREQGCINCVGCRSARCMGAYWYYQVFPLTATRNGSTTGRRNIA